MEIKPVKIEDLRLFSIDGYRQDGLFPQYLVKHGLSYFVSEAYKFDGVVYLKRELFNPIAATKVDAISEIIP